MQATENETGQKPSTFAMFDYATIQNVFELITWKKIQEFNYSEN